MPSIRKIVINLSLISLVLALFSSSAIFATAYDSPSSSTSTSIAYTYSKSFQTSQSQDLTFNFSLQPDFTALFINISPSVPQGQHPIVLKFTGNNSQVTLQQSTAFVGSGKFTYLWSYFTPDTSNDNIQIIASKGYSLQVSLTINGYKGLSTAQDLQSLTDASNNKNSPTTYAISSDTVFYGVITGNDLHDYYQFTFPATIKVSIEVSIVNPYNTLMDIYTKYTMGAVSNSVDHQFSSASPINTTVTVNFFILGLSFPPQLDYELTNNATSSIFIYKVAIYSTSLSQATTPTSTSLPATTTSHSHSLDGFEFLGLSVLVVLPFLKNKRI